MQLQEPPARSKCSFFAPGRWGPDMQTGLRAMPPPSDCRRLVQQAQELCCSLAEAKQSNSLASAVNSKASKKINRFRRGRVLVKKCTYSGHKHRPSLWHRPFLYPTECLSLGNSCRTKVAVLACLKKCSSKSTLCSSSY